MNFDFKKRTLFDEINENRLILGAVIFIFMIICFVYLYFAKKIYQSDATIEIVPKNSILTSKINPGENSEFERFFQTQMDFLKSRYLLNKVLQKTRANIFFYKKGFLGKKEIIEPPIKIVEFNPINKPLYMMTFHIRILNNQKYKISYVEDAFIPKEDSGIVCEFGKNINTNYLFLNLQQKPFKNNIKNF